MVSSTTILKKNITSFLNTPQKENCLSQRTDIQTDLSTYLSQNSILSSQFLWTLASLRVMVTINLRNGTISYRLVWQAWRPFGLLRRSSLFGQIGRGFCDIGYPVCCVFAGWLLWKRYDCQVMCGPLHKIIFRALLLSCIVLRTFFSGLDV